MTGAVPLGAYGLILLAADGGPKERWAAPRCVVAALLALAVGEVLRIAEAPPAPAPLGQA
jgi:hypothetical protein